MKKVVGDEKKEGSCQVKDMTILLSYVHVVTEQGPGSILQPALMSGAVQNPGKNGAQRQPILRRGVVKAPAPATTASVGGRRFGKRKTESGEQSFIKVYLYHMYTQNHSIQETLNLFSEFYKFQL